MVTIDTPTCVLLGSAVALRYEPLLKTQSDALRLRAFIVTAFGFAPLGMLFDLYFHEWQWQYFGTAPWMSMAFAVSMPLGGLIGFELSRRALLNANRKGALAVAGAAAAFTALYSLIFFRRVFWVGSLSEWEAGSATFMLSHTSFMILLASTGAYLALSIWLWILRKPAQS